MSKFYTYEVLEINENEEVVNKTKFNTHLESKCFYEIQSEESNAHKVQQVKITNGTEREVIREHIIN